MVTLSELLNNKKLKFMNLIAGQSGVSRVVSGAIMLDNPEMVNWMREGEILLTTGYLLKDDPIIQSQLITDLVKTNAGGLVIKMKRYFDVIPRAMIKKANELAFPLLEVPYYMSLSELSEIINKHIYFTERDISDSENSLSEMLFEIIRNNGSANAILELAKSYTSNAYALLDSNMKTICVSNNFYKFIGLTPIVGKLLFAPAATQSYIDMISLKLKPIDISIDPSILPANLAATVYPIQSEGEILGYLLTISNTGNLSSGGIDLIHNKIIMALSILLLKEKACFAYKNRKSDIVFEKLLYNELLTEDELEKISSKYNFPLNDQYICCIVSFTKIREIKFSTDWIAYKTFQSEQIINCWDNYSKSNCKLVPIKNNLIIVLQISNPLNTTIDTVKNFCSDIQTLLIKNGLHKDVLFGIGGIISGLANIHTSYYHAKRVIDIMPKINRETIGIFADYIVYELINNTPYIQEILKSKLMPIISYDLEHNTELLSTLEIYLNNNQNSTETSKSLFIHRNTLHYRLSRIQEIINIDFNNPKEVLIYQLAIKSLSL